MNYGDALRSLSSSSSWSWDGQDYEGITWHSENTDDIPTKEELDAEVTRLQAEYDGLSYARARALTYPSLSEFVEAYTEKEIGEDSTKWDAYVVKYNQVRTDNPKE